MLVVKVCMWPGGDRARERVVSVAAIDLLGQANEDRPDIGVRKGERRYRVRLFKDVEFGGPDASGDLPATTWRTGRVRGHLPGRRGVWDLIGGALKVVLRDRLDDYVEGDSEAPR
jgi:hypothetical protein